MSKNVLVLIAGTIIAVIVVGSILILRKPALSPSTDNQSVFPTKTESTQLNEDDDTPGETGSTRYKEYSKDVLKAAANTRRILFFYADWCPTCRPADQDFQTNSDRIPQDVTLIRVNYNDSNTDQSEKDLAQKYGITYQHTFVQIDSGGNVVTKWNGGQLEQLLANIM